MGVTGNEQSICERSKGERRGSLCFGRVALSNITVQSTSLTMQKGGESPRISYPRQHTQLAKTLPRIDIVEIKGLGLTRRHSCLSIFNDLCGFCLLDLGSEDLK